MVGNKALLRLCFEFEHHVSAVCRQKCWQKHFWVSDELSVVCRKKVFLQKEGISAAKPHMQKLLLLRSPGPPVELRHPRPSRPPAANFSNPEFRNVK